jgi:hypothetical protein
MTDLGAHSDIFIGTNVPLNIKCALSIKDENGFWRVFIVEKVVIYLDR